MQNKQAVNLMLTTCLFQILKKMQIFWIPQSGELKQQITLLVGFFDVILYRHNHRRRFWRRRSDIHN